MSTVCGETKFFKIKIKQVCHSAPQLRWNSTEVWYRTPKEGGEKKKPTKVILAMKQLSLIKPALTPKVEISDQLFLSLFPFSLISKDKHFGPRQPKATHAPLQQQPGSISGLSAPAPKAAASLLTIQLLRTNKTISRVLNTKTKALLCDVSHKLFPL